MATLTEYIGIRVTKEVWEWILAQALVKKASFAWVIRDIIYEAKERDAQKGR